MKIIITENQYKKLLEQQLDIFDDVDICQTGIDYENFNPWQHWNAWRNSI